MGNEKKRCGFGEKMKTARKAQNISQSKLAEMLGWPQPHISDFETGKRNPTYDTMCIIADALNCTVEIVPAAPEEKEERI